MGTGTSTTRSQSPFCHGFSCASRVVLVASRAAQIHVDTLQGQIDHVNLLMLVCGGPGPYLDGGPGLVSHLELRLDDRRGRLLVHLRSRLRGMGRLLGMHHGLLLFLLQV